ncbi:hypothetical protein A3D72_03275 [Candidatus Uhrbacteria bacterium RIFCSPHIGHO2_02_FULL_57_19]|uniref:Glycosyltransferase RgtA/B/C/D-like domain-containing protein n=1 Tax=Candidatus Uhrbacteria bacterium RIFCSPHIGHO2_02_FULL_57_19 TaxID=1802391 RepID=A0A1F7U5C8_9BACT|nr:MAG: hypothetical protein A3D72_03275 [Candidatus Uhrbacteria bacterium RIFCSPHIGHO2_02_FULL_57_19]
MQLSLSNYITAGAVFLALAAANLLIWHNPAVGLILIVDILLHGLVLGGLALPKLPFGWRLAFGTLAVAAFKIVSGTAIYFLTDLGPASLIILSSLPLFILGGWWSHKPKPLSIKLDQEALRRPLDFPAAVLGVAVIFLDLAAFRLVDLSRITSAVRSPWETVPWEFFLLFGLASAGLATLAVTGRGRRIVLLLSILHTFIGVGIALTVYRMGFGFDPFIHQAAESIIAKAGLILPKTPYYLGQYVMVVGVARIGAFPLDIFDRALVPVLAAGIIPLFLHWLSMTGRKSATLSPLALILPLPMFILTTPQGFANLWLLAAAATAGSAALPAWLVWLFALAAAATHPIAGVPAMALAAFASIGRLRTTCLPARQADYRLQLRFFLFIIAVAALPFAFWLNARSGGVLNVEIVKPSLGALLRLLPIPALTIPNHFDLPLDLAYLLRWNIPLVIIGLAILGVWRFKIQGRGRTFLPHLLTALAMVGSYLFVRGAMRFPGIIGYEETIFPARLLEAATIVLVPTMAAGAADLIRRLNTASLRVGAVILFSGMMTSAAYLSYPRVDRYEKSSGRSLSASMIHAVQFLEKNAKQPYIVLADQNAAAAQIKTFGFGPYYGGSYFYSHPSGGLPLYRYYQKMVEGDPTRDVALAAMDFAGTDKAYFIIHDYWKNFPRIVSQAQETADDWAEIDGGAIYIFRYSRDGAPGIGTKNEIF